MADENSIIVSMLLEKIKNNLMRIEEIDQRLTKIEQQNLDIDSENRGKMKKKHDEVQP